MTIDELIADHWGETVVLEGETPEAFASRRQEARLREWAPEMTRGVVRVLCRIEGVGLRWACHDLVSDTYWIEREGV